MRVAQKVITKVLGYSGGMQSHEFEVATYNELDTCLLERVDGTGNFKIFLPESSSPLTQDDITTMLARGPTSEPLVFRVRPDIPDRAVPGNSSLGEIRPVEPLSELAVKQQSHDSPPVVTWRVPKLFDSSTARVPQIDYYEVKVTNENDGAAEVEDKLVSNERVEVPTNGREPYYSIASAEVDKTHRVEVTAFCKGQPIGKKIVRFVKESKLAPRSLESKQDLEVNFEMIERTSTNKRVVIPIIGKQHHGKSSLINHLARLGNMDISFPDRLESAPPSAMETTLRSKTLEVDFNKSKFVFVDLPAFGTMDASRKKDLNHLLWSYQDNWARDQGGSWWPASNPPDAVVIVVSLLSWRDEPDSLREYLKELQGVLKGGRACNASAVFPYVVAATHKDRFMQEEGNKGNDPRKRLQDAEESLKSLANTNNVYTLTCYKATSWWSPSVTRSTFCLLEQVRTLAQNRTRTTSEKIWSNSSLVGVCIVVVVLAVAVARGSQ